ncbi:hypothetical protein GU926_10560 [Nibribacter ruber]|uniref:Lipoprotein n=1 Tax=Nibribacter ruber TaxID=2698458 RepID=A0A6P1NVW3_9BACT|nr:hypothetical protein [Nibribacter ruber]QHL87847.1 hypothetical protein GU926_10560 [Nibribacter ruber]
MSSRKFSLVSVFLLAAALTACSVPEMQVSQSFKEKATELPVEGRKVLRMNLLGKEKGFRFGPYQLQEIQRGWTSRANPQDAFWLKLSEAYQRYSFAVQDTVQQKTSFVLAAALYKSASVEVEGAPASLKEETEFLQAQFKSPESGVWQLSLADPGSYLQRVQFQGSLANGQQSIEIQPIYKWKGMSIPSGDNLGYEFSVNGEILATVQISNSGKVWLKQGLSPDLQMVLASACSSLLLYDKLGAGE